MGKIEYLICSTFHDPEFKLHDLLESALPKLKELFVKATICLTPYTPNNVLNFLKDEGFNAIIEPSDRHIDTYRTALRTTLDNIDKPNFQRIFLIDFDRLVHWIHSYPDELTNILKKDLDVDLLHIGRTPRAFDTHPTTQKKTKIVVNEFGSRALGFSDTMDIISVCYVFTKELGETIMNVKNTTSTGFYGSWPIILWSLATKKQYIEVEGHEWETPDRFSEEITEMGYKKWLKEFESPQEWLKRVTFLHECLLEISMLTKFKISLDKKI